MLRYYLQGSQLIFSDIIFFLTWIISANKEVKKHKCKKKRWCLRKRTALCDKYICRHTAITKMIKISASRL